MQISQDTSIPIVHTVELIDWATGGAIPEAILIAGVSPKAVLVC
jgi:glycolate oxidase iron-sulfur subunit